MDKEEMRDFLAKLNGEPVLTVKEFARLMHVHTATVYTWIREKKVTAHRRPGGSWRVPVTELTRLIKPTGSDASVATEG